jgi:hypothetical protein
MALLRKNGTPIIRHFGGGLDPQDPNLLHFSIDVFSTLSLFTESGRLLACSTFYYGGFLSFELQISSVE